MLKKQTYYPKDVGPHNTAPIRTLGLDHPEGIYDRQGRNWSRYQACRHGTFSLVALESYRTGADFIGYTRQEDYIKVNFWLSGKHTTVLDGFGEREHDRPAVFITCGPWDMIKMDILNRDTHVAAPRFPGKARQRQDARLHEAREMLARRYAEPITLKQITREVGLNKMVLTSGFRRLFGMSVYDCLQKERMERAYELLQDEAYTVAQVAEAVGYVHSCNFSTAFRARFGCTPQEARGQCR